MSWLIVGSAGWVAIFPRKPWRPLARLFRVAGLARSSSPVIPWAAISGSALWLRCSRMPDSSWLLRSALSASSARLCWSWRPNSPAKPEKNIRYPPLPEAAEARRPAAVRLYGGRSAGRRPTSPPAEHPRLKELEDQPRGVGARLPLQAGPAQAVRHPAIGDVSAHGRRALAGLNPSIAPVHPEVGQPAYPTVPRPGEQAADRPRPPPGQLRGLEVSLRPAQEPADGGARPGVGVVDVLGLGGQGLRGGGAVTAGQGREVVPGLLQLRHPEVAERLPLTGELGRRAGLCLLRLGLQGVGLAGLFGAAVAQEAAPDGAARADERRDRGGRHYRSPAFVSGMTQVSPGTRVPPTPLISAATSGLSAWVRTSVTPCL